MFEMKIKCKDKSEKTAQECLECGKCYPKPIMNVLLSGRDRKRVERDKPRFGVTRLTGGCLRKTFYDLTEELLKQLGSFVYVWNDIKRKLDKKEQEQNLKIMLEREGFKEIKFIKLKKDETIEEFYKRQEKYYKQFDRLKGEFVLDVDFIGILGGFDKKVIKEGKLIYSEYNKYLMLIPKRCRTRGHIIRDKIYYKEV